MPASRGDDGHVDVDDVAGTERPGVGDAVAYHLVDGDAGGRREAAHGQPAQPDRVGRRVERGADPRRQRKAGCHPQVVQVLADEPAVVQRGGARAQHFGGVAVRQPVQLGRGHAGPHVRVEVGQQLRGLRPGLAHAPLISGALERQLHAAADEEQPHDAEQAHRQLAQVAALQPHIGVG